MNPIDWSLLATYYWPALLLGLWFFWIFDCQFDSLRIDARRRKLVGQTYYFIWLSVAFALLAFVPCVAEYLFSLPASSAFDGLGRLPLIGGYLSRLARFAESSPEPRLLYYAGGYVLAIILAYRALDLTLRAAHGCSLRELMGKGSTADGNIGSED